MSQCLSAKASHPAAPTKPRQQPAKLWSLPPPLTPAHPAGASRNSSLWRLRWRCLPPHRRRARPLRQGLLRTRIRHAQSGVGPDELRMPRGQAVRILLEHGWPVVEHAHRFDLHALNLLPGVEGQIELADPLETWQITDAGCSGPMRHFGS